MSVPRWFQRILDYHDVPYQEHHHPPVHAASHLAHAEHVPGRRVAKTVFLAARNRPIMVVLPASARLDLERVRAVLGEADLRMATEDEIAGWFKGCAAGCVPPFPLRGGMRILMDRSLAQLGQIVFAAGTPEVSLAMRFRDWYRAVRPGVGRFAAADDSAGRQTAAAPVLVVEDESDTNHLLCQLLQREGVPCRGVEAGGAAVEAAAQAPPVAILLDLMLPDMSGFEVVEKLRRVGSLRRIPWIVLTALDDEASRRRGEELGAEAYLTKPLEPRAIVAEVQDILADARV
jgi:CheY-like chemotaxis protein/prolyl-tRNA editing enzyme YbaK/EbsC (Cys-tRNA(Pro) deacylase)